MRAMIGAIALCVATVALAGPGDSWDSVRYRYWPHDQRSDWRAVEDQIAAIPDAGSLAEMHEQLASVPHATGTTGDGMTVNRIADLMTSFGLEVERHPIWVYVARPVDAKLEIIEPEHIELSLMEKPVEGDPDSANKDLDFGWNAYSGSGDVFGQVVYVNYASKEDFDKLAELGVQVTGKIVIARYGKIFRGYKARNAELAGAIGLILYTDPADDGWGKGRPYPTGGYANETSIQRGSIDSLTYPGDPLTPDREATQDAPRKNEFDVELPAIPVQPVGWGAAGEILSRMTGDIVPPEWKGGLPFPYAIEGGPDLKVRLMVEQKRDIVPTWNVIGTIKGTGEPDQEVYVGAHHDAWGFGAADPLSGTICMLETARTFGQMAKEGHLPFRTLRFCAWAAEEHGLIGSTEYYEQRQHPISGWGVAYINLDASALGPDFGAMASPCLRTLIAEAAHDVPQAGDPSRTAFEGWLSRGEDPNVPGDPKFSDPGGGSDYAAFWGKGGVPVADLHAGGAKGTAYHSAYDTLAWYRKVVGSDYESALMVTRITTLVVARLANAPLVPLDTRRILVESRAGVYDISKLGMEHDFFSEPNGIVDRNTPIPPEMARLAGAASSGVAVANRAYDAIMKRVDAGTVSDDFMRKLTQSAISATRVWVYPRGIPGREWFTNMYALPDEETGYGSSVFPWLRTAIRRNDMAMFAEGEIKLLSSVVQAAQTIQRAEAALALEPETQEEEAPTPDGG